MERGLDALRQITAARELLKIGVEPWRFPPRRRDERPVEKRTLPITEWLAIGTIDQSAGGEQDCMSRSGIPFAGWRCAGVNVGIPFRDDAEFQRGADRNIRTCLHGGL